MSEPRATVSKIMKRLLPQPDQRIDFLRGFLRRPHQVGSVIPSSRFLERRLVELAELADARAVVELGPGTGGTTRALLRALPGQARLLAIELEPEFVRLLGRIRDPRLAVERGSAAELTAIVAAHGLPPLDAVISGIPFSTMEAEHGRRILCQIRDALAQNGRFVAYQVRDRVGELGTEVFGRPRIELELRNIPPVRIFSWHGRAASASGAA